MLRQLLLTGVGLPLTSAFSLDTSSTASLKSGAQTLAKQLFASFPPSNGFFPQLAPYYWYQGGATWGAMIDYYANTGDSQFNQLTLSSLAAQVGANFDYVPASQATSEANDDQAIWIFAVLDALESNFPALSVGPGYLAIANNAYNEFVSRYQADSNVCNGGLRWQFNPANTGYDYKNAISNGGFFNIAARLAQHTKQQKYADWAARVWDWEQQTVGIIDPQYAVYDGVHVEDNCRTIDGVQWTYNSAIHMHGAAVMYAFTGEEVWRTRAMGLLAHAQSVFFTPFNNATDVMYEARCERVLGCGIDNASFKAFLSRFLGKVAVVMPETKSTIAPLLVASAQGAARACSGPGGPAICGQAWWYNGWDGTRGLGQQLSALEIVQAVLAAGAEGAKGESATSSAKPAPVVAPATSKAVASSTSTSSLFVFPKVTSSKVAPFVVVSSTGASSKATGPVFFPAASTTASSKVAFPMASSSQTASSKSSSAPSQIISRPFGEPVVSVSTITRSQANIVTGTAPTTPAIAPSSHPNAAGGGNSGTMTTVMSPDATGSTANQAIASSGAKRRKRLFWKEL